MRLPSKICTLEDSIISKLSIVLNVVKDDDISIHDLNISVRTHFNCIDEYIEVLDCLYTLGKLEINSDTRRLHYVI